MIEIDGSYGEGGGQVLRTALALAAVTGQPCQIYHIRARRRNPGLAPQHLTGVQALARLCAAEVRGAALRATELVFAPQGRPQAGDYTFDVTEATEGGSAGAVSLILQAILLPLALADGPSRVVLRGGTHVAWSPPFDYLAEVYLPALARMGLTVDLQLDRWGFYPVGGGQMTVSIAGLGDGAALQPLTLLERGDLQRVGGRAVAGELPSHIPQRMTDRARKLLSDRGLPVDIRPERVRSPGPGAGIFLAAEYEHSRAGFSALGRKGKASELVAEEACQALLAHHRSGTPVDPHLADQLLLPLALADGSSEFRTGQVTGHLLTNAQVIRRFIPVEIAIDGAEGEPGTVRVRGIARFSTPRTS